MHLYSPQQGSPRIDRFSHAALGVGNHTPDIDAGDILQGKDAIALVTLDDIPSGPDPVDAEQRTAAGNIEALLGRAHAAGVCGIVKPRRGIDSEIIAHGLHGRRHDPVPLLLLQDQALGPRHTVEEHAALRVEEGLAVLGLLAVGDGARPGDPAEHLVRHLLQPRARPATMFVSCYGASRRRPTPRGRWPRYPRSRSRCSCRSSSRPPPSSRRSAAPS